jgi:hypothetical protein
MKKSFVLFAVAVLFCGVTNVYALDLGENITIPDLMTESGNTWYGPQEDEEVEPGDMPGQHWDLEGFFFKGTTLRAVGGFDFIKGQGGVKTGDIFIDVDGDAQYGPSNDNTGAVELLPPGETSVKNTFGYDYVLDLDIPSLSYNVYAIDDTSTTTVVYYDINQESNPWRYASGGQLLGSGSIDYMAGLTDAEVGFAGGLHNVLSVNLGFLDPGISFTAHLTIECGNDNLMGHYDPVPEPGTLFLLGSGLFGVLAFGRKRLKK